MEAFDAIRAGVATNRAQFYEELTLPFYGYNRPGAKVSEGVREHWWLQGMMGGVKAHYDCVKAFSETDFTEDLKKIDVPTLILHGDDDQIVPFADASVLSAKLVKKSTLKIYPGLPHGMCTTNAEQISPERVKRSSAEICNHLSMSLESCTTAVLLTTSSPDASTPGPATVTRRGAGVAFAYAKSHL